MKAVTTITITQEVTDDLIPLAKEVSASKLLMDTAKEMIRKSIIENLATKGEEVTVSIECVE